MMPGPRWIFAGIILLAAVLRLVLLGLRPPHFDEGVNGWFVDSMIRQGYYHYDPANYHGPLHFYLLFLFERLLGRHIWALRLPVALVSIATVWLVLQFRRFLDWRICAWAAAAMAVSPAMVFYGRYAIHEAALVFFLVLTTFGFAGMWARGSRGWLWTAGMGLAGAVLTKETYLIHFVCFILAAAFWLAWGSFFPTAGPARARRIWSVRDLLAVAGASLALIVFFYSGTFMDWPGLTGIWQTFHFWADTGAKGEGHNKPFWHWLLLLARYEQPALAGLAGAIAALRMREHPLIRYVAIYGCGALAAYSIIPYKTPWCIIAILWPFFFLFGSLASLRRWCAIPGAILLIVSLALSIRLNFFHYTDAAEPYVYVQTFEDIHRLTGPLQQLAAEDPEAFQMSGHMILSSYHPLPWVLGDFPNVGYYPDSLPADADADILLVDESRVGAVEAQLRDAYFTEPLHLREAQEPSRLYLRASRFAPIFPDRELGFIPADEPSL